MTRPRDAEPTTDNRVGRPWRDIAVGAIGGMHLLCVSRDVAGVGKHDVVSGSKIELGHGVACGEGCLPGGCARATTPHELHLDAGWEAPGHGVRETPGVGGMGRRPWGEL